eukprot:478099_1
MALYFLYSLSFLLTFHQVSSWDIKKYNGTANPSSIVIVNNKARFTILSENLIRLEYSNNGKFEDRPSVTAVNRYTSKTPQFTNSTSGDITTITTKYLTLTYKQNTGSFNPKSLSIKGQFPAYNNLQFEYKPSAASNSIFNDNSWSNNLFGTLGSLDESNGTVPLNCTLQKERKQATAACYWGVIGRQGYALIDDTKQSMLQTDGNWLSCCPYIQNNNQQDYYFFGHGLDFGSALKDFQLISGTIPMLPRYALGSWHTRWYDYSDLSIRQIIDIMVSTEIPLDVFVWDMNWHLNFNAEKPWGAYTWNPSLYPDPNITQSFIKSLGLRSSANIHDNSGICTYEQFYSQAAAALNVTNGNNITANFSDENYVKVLEDIVLKPIEESVDNNYNHGFDFWWIDGANGIYYSGVSSELWSNYIRSTDHLRRGENVRGMVLSRYGGYGTHRYPVGFSGDVDFHPNDGGHYNGLGHTWSSLDFEPYFTTVAANVGQTWSHDILGAAQDYELNTKWIQMGALSMIMRIHGAGKTQGNCVDTATGCPLIDIWTHPFRNMDIERKVLQFRSELLPYMYNSTYYDTYLNGINLIRPMYYEYPMEENAYISTNFSQYMFGNDIIIRPVTDKSGDGGIFNLTKQSIWIPNINKNDCWYELNSGRYFNDNAIMIRWFDLSEVPIYIRCNSVIVKQPFDKNKLLGRADKKYYDFLRFEIYPSKFANEYIGETNLYEDDGYTYDYLNNSNVITTFNWNFNVNSYLFSSMIKSVGNYNGWTTQRKYSITIYNVMPPTKVMCNKKQIDFQQLWFGAPNGNLQNGWFYNGKDMSVTVNCGLMNVTNVNTISVQFNSNWNNDIKYIEGMKGVINRAILCKQSLDERNVNYGENGPRNNITQIALYSTLLSQRANNGEKFNELVTNFAKLFDDAIEQANNLQEGQTGWQRKHYCVQLMNTI